MRWLGAFSGFFSGEVAFRRGCRCESSSLLVRARGGEEANGVRKKKRPRSPIYRGGAVTGACEAC